MSKKFPSSSMVSSADAPPKNSLGLLIHSTDLAGSVNRISNDFQIASRLEIRSTVSRGSAPPSFFHLKNVDLGGDPRRRICSSVDRFHASARGMKTSSPTGIAVRPPPSWATDGATIKFLPSSRFGLESIFSPVIDSPQRDSWSLLVHPSPARKSPGAVPASIRRNVKCPSPMNTRSTVR